MSRAVDNILAEIYNDIERHSMGYPAIKPKRKPRFNRFLSDELPNTNYMTQNNKTLFLSANDTTDFLTSQFILERCERKYQTAQKNFDIYASLKEWNAYAKDNFSHLRQFKFDKDSDYYFDDVNLSYMTAHSYSTHVRVSIIGDGHFVAENTRQLTTDFVVVENKIEWIYSSDGHSMEIPLRPDRMPVSEMYPFLDGDSLESYYEDYMASDAAILLLIGPPGTGKTSFIRGLLQHSKVSATVTYDTQILEKDHIFAQFIEGDKTVMVLEDADMFLKSRKEGNTMMHKFLNVGDGLVTTKNKKLVFSTNLPSIKDIDPALVRPGRCYDILNFNELTQEQAVKLASRVGVKLTTTRNKWSVADVFHEKGLKPETAKKTSSGGIGFLAT